MPRTSSFFQQDSPFTDLKLRLGAQDFINTGAGTAALTVNAKGDVSSNAAASQALIYNCCLSKVLERLGFPLFLQEQFGTAAGVAGPSAVANTSDPAANKGYPPFTGASYLTPRTGNIAKGLQINDITVVYEIGTTALAAHTFGLSKTVYPTPGTPAALVVSDIVSVGANGLATATNANQQSTKIAVGTPVMNVTDLSDMNIAYNVTVGGSSGTYRFYGMFLHCSFNFN
jgi:hypothetical protein